MSTNILIEYQNVYFDLEVMQQVQSTYPSLNQLPEFSEALNGKRVSQIPENKTSLNYWDTLEYFNQIAEALQQQANRQKLEKEYSNIRIQYASNSDNLGCRLVKAYTRVMKPKPFSQFNRHYPRINEGEDTIYLPLTHQDLLNEAELGLFNRCLLSHIHCESRHRLLSQKMELLGLSYDDQEIVKVYELLPANADNFFCKGLTVVERKCVFIQNGCKGSLTACTNMMISDRLGQYKNYYNSRLSSNIGSDEEMIKIIAINNLKAEAFNIYTLEHLKRALEENGPACIDVRSAAFHKIVVDRVTEEGIDIRDPFHGWAIRITKEAFLSSSGLTENAPLKLIQIIDSMQI